MLRQKMQILHNFHIAHVDIKPGNIMFSQITQQLVLIDFDFSKLVAEEVGFKSLSSFAGSVRYCSPQMIRVYSSKVKCYIDLYYNDMHAIEISASQIKEELNSIEVEENDIYDFLVELTYLTSKELSWEEKKRLFDFDNYAKKLVLKAHIYLFRFDIMQQEVYQKILIKNADFFISLLA